MKAKIATETGTETVEIIEQFTIRDRVFFAHEIWGGHAVSDLLTGRRLCSIVGFDSLAVVWAEAEMIINKVPDEKWKSTFMSLPEINETLNIFNT